MWAGVAAAQEAGVACSKCRLRVILPIGRTPAGCPRHRPYYEQSDWVYAVYTYDAIETWNRIPRKEASPRPARKRRPAG
jgi:hypothetical protein